MKYSTFALALSLGAFAAVSASPANAQIRGSQPKREVVKPATVTLPSGKQVTLSPKFGAAIVELQAAVNAKDPVAIAAKLAVAQREAKSPVEQYLVGMLQTQAAFDANDLANARVAIAALEATGAATAEEVASRWSELGKRHYNAKQFDAAASAFERAVAASPDNPAALKNLGLVRDAQGRKADAVASMLKFFAAAKAAGKPIPEDEYKFALSMAYSAKLPTAPEVARQWVAAYPLPKNWRDGLRVQREIVPLTGDLLLDNLRLAAASNGLSTEAEYHLFLTELAARGLNAEAKAVLAAGIAAKVVDPAKSAFKPFVPAAAKAQTRAQVDATAKTAMAGTAAKAAMAAGDAYYGLGAYAEAAAAYRAALGKSGVDANLANLRLGMALARAGDKAGATAALAAVGGPQVEVAKFWQVWLATRG